MPFDHFLQNRSLRFSVSVIAGDSFTRPHFSSLTIDGRGGIFSCLSGEDREREGQLKTGGGIAHPKDGLDGAKRIRPCCSAERTVEVRPVDGYSQISRVEQRRVEPTEKLDVAAVPDQERGFRVRLLEERDTESVRVSLSGTT